jgi:hypothetical protein
MHVGTINIMHVRVLQKKMHDRNREYGMNMRNLRLP